MTYDWGWQGGPPMAISPIGPVKEVLQYAKSQMPPPKNYDGAKIYTGLIGSFHLNKEIHPQKQLALSQLLH